MPPPYSATRTLALAGDTHGRSHAHHTHQGLTCRWCVAGAGGVAGAAIWVEAAAGVETRVEVEVEAGVVVGVAGVVAGLAGVRIGIVRL